MNLVGKIFVVLIFVMSLVFMSLTIAMYAAHKNWREVAMNEETAKGKPLGYYHQLRQEKTHTRELQDQLESIKNEREKAKKEHEQVLTKALSELDLKTRKCNDLEAGYATLQKKTSDAVAAMNATQASATKYREELEKSRTLIIEAQRDRDAIYKDVVKKTDALTQADSDQAQLKKKMEDLAKDYAKAKEALRWYSIDENSDYKSKTPPKVDGIVSEAPGGGVVVISIGSDSGLRKGHQLQVYGSRGYVGRIEVIKTTPDKSVCKIDPNFQSSNMMKGDRVSSTID
jgi:hypothetical protein